MAAGATRKWVASRARRNARCRARLCLICQAEAGQRHASEADAEFLQRPASRNGLGQALGEFIELVVHTFLSICLLVNRLVAV